MNHAAMPSRKGVLLCVVLYLCFIIIRFPADRVWPELLHRSGVSTEQVLLTGGDGSWLAGSFTLSISGNHAGAIRWQLKPWYLLTGAVGFGLDMKMPGGRLTGDAKKTLWSMGLYDFNGQVPCDLISKLAALPGIDLSGVFDFSDLDITLKKGQLTSAEGEILWQKAGLKKPYNLHAGNFAAEIKTDPEGIKVNVSDKGGGVMVRVAGTIREQGRFGINGEFAARDSAHPDLVSFLKILGEPGPDGRVRLSYRGTLKNLFN